MLASYLLNKKVGKLSQKIRQDHRSRAITEIFEIIPIIPDDEDVRFPKCIEL